MNVLITQSEAWKKLQDDLGETSFFVQKADFQFLAILKTTPVGKYLYCPYGPVARDSKSFLAALAELGKIASKQQAFFIRLEPTDPSLIQKLPKNTQKSKDLNPKETWVLDLPTNREELLQKLPSRLLRYYKNAAKKGLTIEVSHNPADIKHLIELQTALAHAKGINTFSTRYLQTEAKQPFSTIYLVKYHDPEKKSQEIVAAGLVFDDQTTRYNLQGAQSEQGRKLHATGILTIQLILDAYEKGLKTFDFWGIAPTSAGPDHPWYGFTNFKKTFAGREVVHAGTYDIVLNPLKYNLYRLARPLARFIS